MRIKSKGKFNYGDKYVVGRKAYTFGPKDNVGALMSGYVETDNFIKHDGKVLGEYPEPPKQTREKWKLKNYGNLEKQNQ